MINFANIAEPVATALLGEPNHNLSNATELRWGARGSLALNRQKGAFYDHENGEGYGVLELIKRETGANPNEWLTNQGFKAPEPVNTNKQGTGRAIAFYDYCNEVGELVYQVVRFEPKDFRQRRPDPTKPTGWNWSVKGVEPLPYRLQEMASNPGVTVFICEGEKDADNLAALGFLTTTNSGGAKKNGKGWPPSLNRYFAGRDVVILADNDAAGRDHSRAIALSLSAAGVEKIKLVDLPGLANKGDVSDWIAAGGTREKMLELVKAAPMFEAAQLPTPAANDNLTDVHTMPPVPPGTWPHMSEKGKPLNTIPNLNYMLRHYGFNVRYDVIGKDLKVTYPGQSGLVDNSRAAAINTVLSLCALNGLPKTEAAEFLLSIGDQHPINSVMEWITSNPWDGISRLDELAGTLTTRPGYDRNLLRLLLRRWLISAVAAAAMPHGFRSKGVLTLQGPQSAGKTAWFTALVPAQKRELVKIDAIIDPYIKDSVISAVSSWIVELGELEGTFRKSDIARLKGFISADYDQFRRPYGRTEEKYPRKTVFCASVNPNDFLVDDTGNSRWWTIPVISVNYEHRIDMQQLWAEVYEWFKAGERWWLDREEENLLEQSNGDHKQADPIEDLILTAFDIEAPRTMKLTATDVLIKIGYDRPTNAQAQKAATILKAVFGQPRRVKGRTFYEVPKPWQDQPPAYSDEQPY
ncbi:virulence-associated E family protein [Thiomicrospira aerophila AL3]|uniref:Virulence-associated E family protein n=1 Tax=Thiomicrospira aerophila AL3 TaxID=717772 RepID=W0DSD8_9GAMM|nr:VapE domain-containing protein [Thiomicrospira aerophila]AHF01367.1 virulence-associated E family protein [Thiomicrospira aerophila AL3]